MIKCPLSQKKGTPSQQTEVPKPSKQEMLDAIMDAVCPPGSKQEGVADVGGQAKRNSVDPKQVNPKQIDPEQNAQHWNYSDYSSQGSICNPLVQCSQFKDKLNQEDGDRSVSASPTPVPSRAPSPRSRVSVTPGMAVTDSSSPPRVFSPPGGTGSVEVFKKFEAYEGKFRRAKQLEERFDRELGPQLFDLQLRAEEAMEELYQMEGNLSAESLAKIQRIELEFENHMLEGSEAQRRQWRQRCAEQAQALKDFFYGKLREIQSECMHKLDNIQPEFNQIKRELKDLQQDWTLMHQSMEDLYRSVAAEDALEARLMTKHQELRMPQV